MHAGRQYSLKEIISWTRRETAIFVVLAALPTLAFQLLGWTWLTLPWLPIALVGTAVAFITGFKNSASYNRLWEARQAWGAIINSTRAWGIYVLDLPDEGVRRRLAHRHIAWLTALRYQLREARPWENMSHSHNAEYRQRYHIDEWTGKLDHELEKWLGHDEAARVLSRKSRALYLLSLQAAECRQLATSGVITEFRHYEMERLMTELLDAQGVCERIKNFPYPRQFATLNLLFVWLFIALTPLGLLQEFKALGASYVWITIPASVVVSWVFHTMDKIGGISENPFEGSPNDVPITALSRTAEIDLLEMLGETNLPAPLQPVNHILM
jgi:ion channel-forming bestrophin family protein